MLPLRNVTFSGSVNIQWKTACIYLSFVLSCRRTRPSPLSDLSTNYASGFDLPERFSDAYQSPAPPSAEASTGWHLPRLPSVAGSSPCFAGGALPASRHGAVRSGAPCWPRRRRWVASRSFGAIFQSAQPSDIEFESEFESA